MTAGPATVPPGGSASRPPDRDSPARRHREDAAGALGLPGAAALDGRASGVRQAAGGDHAQRDDLHRRRRGRHRRSAGGARRGNRESDASTARRACQARPRAPAARRPGRDSACRRRARSALRRRHAVRRQPAHRASAQCGDQLGVSAARLSGLAACTPRAREIMDHVANAGCRRPRACRRSRGKTIAGDADLVGDRGCVEPAGAAEGEQRELARVEPLLEQESRIAAPRLALVTVEHALRPPARPRARAARRSRAAIAARAAAHVERHRRRRGNSRDRAGRARDWRPSPSASSPPRP